MAVREIRDIGDGMVLDVVHTLAHHLPEMAMICVEANGSDPAKANKEIEDLTDAIMETLEGHTSSGAILSLFSAIVTVQKRAEEGLKMMQVETEDLKNVN